MLDKEILQETVARIARLSAELKGLEASKEKIEQRIFRHSVRDALGLRSWWYGRPPGPIFFRARYSDGVALCLLIYWTENRVYFVQKNPSGWSKAIDGESRADVFDHRVKLCPDDEQIENRKQAENIFNKHRFDVKKTRLVRIQNKKPAALDGPTERR